MRNSPITRARLVLTAAIIASLGAGCVHTQSEVQVKPVDINLNITGRLEVVITDARQTEEEISGSKPKRVVTPADIGLPADAVPQSAAQRNSKIADEDDAARGFVRVADDTREQIIQRMRARHPQIHDLRDQHLVGESHLGYLVARAQLSPEQQALVNAENADRAQLYNLEVAKRSVPVDKVALGYYLARLEHVDQGTWVERFDKASGSWQWVQWNE